MVVGVAVVLERSCHVFVASQPFVRCPVDLSRLVNVGSPVEAAGFHHGGEEFLRVVFPWLHVRLENQLCTLPAEGEKKSGSKLESILKAPI